MNNRLAIAMMVLALSAKPALAQSDSGPQSDNGFPQGLQTRGRIIPEANIADFSGPRAEVRLDWSELDAPGPSYGYGYCGIDFCGYSTSIKLDSNFNVGGELGYDFAVSRHVTVGPYAKFTNKISNSSGCLACDGDDYALGIRAGYVLSSKFLVYGKVGYNNLKSVVNYNYTDNSGNSYSGSDTFHYKGTEVGFGVNYRPSKKYYLGMEFTADDYGNGDPYYGGNQRFGIGLTFGKHF